MALHDMVEPSLKIVPSGEALGADVLGIDLSQDIDEMTFRTIEQAWLDHLVLRLRGQRLTDAQLIAFSRWFGDLDLARLDDYKPFVQDHPEIMVISNVVVDGQPIGKLGAYEAEWHTDLSYVEKPPKASLLHALEVPKAGGNTGFLNMYRAYETLPAELKAAVCGRFCKHDASRNSAGVLRAGFEEVDDPRDVPGPLQPLVRIHPQTRKKALYLGRRRSASIVGLPLDESEKLLDALWAHATQPTFTWTQVWHVGDLIVWDNRCVMHRRDAFDPTMRRIMHRTQVQDHTSVEIAR